MEKIPDSALILVAVTPTQRDLEIARLLGWYRIPLKTAPKVIPVDYLAFYQTAAFGKDHHWRIETCARVRGYELTTRAELLRDEPDHPRATEEYFKLQLGPLERLSKPIISKGWKRLTFLYTTGELFNKAEAINDLVVKSDERQVLWHALRERALRSGKYHLEELPEMVLDDNLQVLLGISGLLGE